MVLAAPVGQVVSGRRVIHLDPRQPQDRAHVTDPGAGLSTLQEAPSETGEYLIVWELLWIKVRILYWKNFHLVFASVNASVAYWCAGEGNIGGAMINIACFGYMMMRWSAHRDKTKNF